MEKKNHPSKMIKSILCPIFSDNSAEESDASISSTIKQMARAYTAVMVTRNSPRMVDQLTSEIKKLTIESEEILLAPQEQESLKQLVLTGELGFDIGAPVTDNSIQRHEGSLLPASSYNSLSGLPNRETTPRN
jgi:hypothetical protein